MPSCFIKDRWKTYWLPPLVRANSEMTIVYDWSVNVNLSLSQRYVGVFLPEIGCGLVQRMLEIQQKTF